MLNTLDTIPGQKEHDSAWTRRDHHAQATPERALARLWTRQYTAEPRRCRPPLAFPFHTRTPL